MDVIRFALGFRFDTPDESLGADEREHAFGLLFSRIDAKLLEGLKVYAGHFMIDDNDDERIFTVVTMGLGLKRSKAFYNAVKSDPYIMSMLTDRRPIIQSNVVFHIEQMDYYGEFDAQGNLSGGETEFQFKRIPKEKLPAISDASRLKIVLAPDKFKGSMNQFEVIDILKKAVRNVLPGATAIAVPAADGGDGTGKVLQKLMNGRKRVVAVTGPDWQKIQAEYCFVGAETAVIEMAQASGLARVSGKNDPMDATSKGTGELIADALKNGAKRLLIGIGGSATNDGGIGAAIALGARFTDEVGNEFEGCASNMEFVRNIDLSGMDPLIKGAEIIVLSDVTNPLTGKNGATRIFGPQKGADEETLTALERGMKNLEHRYDAVAGRAICSEPGAGAAGGMGAMLMALLGAKIVNGAANVLDAVNFNKLIEGADLVITGEGRFDNTSIECGKATGEVIRRAAQAGIETAVIAGSLGDGWEKVYDITDAGVFSTVTGPIELDKFAENDAERLLKTAERALRLYRKML